MSKGYQSTSYVSKNMSPTFAFEANDIEFWGSAKDKIDSIALSSKDLIINLTGFKTTITPFVKEGPDWMGDFIKPGENVPQIVLEWKDYQPPPSNVGMDFWQTIVERAKEHGITRIIVCCTAGQGRTGTALSAFFMACDEDPEPFTAVSEIRSEYSEHAVETQGQFKYLLGLVYDTDDVEKIIKEEEDREKEEEKEKSRATTAMVSSRSHSGYADAEDAEVEDWIKSRGYKT